MNTKNTAVVVQENYLEIITHRIIKRSSVPLSANAAQTLHILNTYIIFYLLEENVKTLKLI